MKLEETKEAIVYYRDEYPSCRSSDCNGSWSKKELTNDCKVQSTVDGQGTSIPGFEAKWLILHRMREILDPMCCLFSSCQ